MKTINIKIEMMHVDFEHHNRLRKMLPSEISESLEKEKRMPNIVGNYDDQANEDSYSRAAVNKVTVREIEQQSGALQPSLFRLS